MRPFSAIALFCEDIREEKSGVDSLMGVLPDNINVGNLPGMLVKLCVYFRIQLDVDVNPKTMKARIKLPGAAPIEIATFDDLIETSKQHAEAIGLPFAGMIAKAIFTPLAIDQLGKIEAFIEVDGTEYICGALNLVQSAPNPVPSASSVLQPPA